jgi:hypothetical protein
MIGFRQKNASGKGGRSRQLDSLLAYGQTSGFQTQPAGVQSQHGPIP